MTTEIATDSLAQLQKNLDKANLALSKAQGETTRLNRVRFSLQADIADLNARLKAIRQKAFESVAFEKRANAIPYWTESEKLKVERDNLVQTVSYIVTWLFEDATLKEMEANIDEREATAILFAAQGEDIRQRAITAASKAAEIDPGMSVLMRPITDKDGHRLGSASKSHQLSEKAEAIWNQIPQLRSDLDKRRGQAAREQIDMAASTFNI